MRMLITFEAFESITGVDQVAHLRQQVGVAIERTMKAGVVESSGIWMAGRGGFLVVEVESAEQLFGLLGGEIVDHMKIEARPVIAVETLVKYFGEHPAA